jgi:hypothetical protein
MFNFLVEPRCVERLEPGAKHRKLSRRQLRDGFFYDFYGHAV